MRDELKRHVELLFAGTAGTDEIQEEILQNTLDRYDDLIHQGKSPQAAYQLAIMGIGDINEILGSQNAYQQAAHASPVVTAKEEMSDESGWKKALLAIGICLYILCPIPLFILQNELGLCALLAVVAIATVLVILSGNKKSDVNQKASAPNREIRKAVGGITWAVGLCVYFALSFSTDAWYITWVIFPLTSAVQGLIVACIDLKEANKIEK